ncbi:hypothetical protein HMPREF1981_01478 [Bacteroides pyogenes F0041]|uniref:Uncharacterized protein n=1 Tax=Bacteroides pyogenes F0041 TaxID=1321819 RepID=U2C5B9_9BACE|nr:hypothetical protein HMPREF1981_01478 [Bacteroides pyogenes F0041]GAE21574.1 hypothetical protein JCM10003_1041 [Bacteroides pyogenes JCM 10003]
MFTMNFVLLQLSHRFLKESLATVYHELRLSATLLYNSLPRKSFSQEVFSE